MADVVKQHVKRYSRKSNCLLFVSTLVATLMVELSTFFSSSGLGLLNNVKNVIFLFVVFLLYLRNRRSPYAMPRNIKFFIGIMIVLIFIELITLHASSIFGIVIGLFLLGISGKYSDECFLRYLFLSIIIVSLISSVPLVYFYYLYGYFAKTEIFFEKPFLTFLFGVSSCYLTILLLFSSKHKIWIAAVIAYLLICNVYILQSKTSLFEWLAVVGLLCLFRGSLVIAFLKRCKYVLLLLCAALCFLPIRWEIPDPIKQAANKLVGYEMYTLSRELREDTYDIRGKIMDRTIQIVWEDPIMGAGFGNQEEALRPTKTGLTQGESQILDMLLDGGLTYLSAFLIMVFCFVKLTFVRLKNNTNPGQNLMLCTQMIGFVILCIGNEMLYSLTWIYLGAMSWLAYSNVRYRILE